MIVSRKSSYSIRFSLLYAAWFTVIGIQLPFWPVWLKAHGLDASDIGLVLTMGLFMKVVSGPLLAQIADHYGFRRNLIIVLAWASLASFSLFAVAKGFLAIAAVTVLASCFFPSIIPFVDNLLLLSAREEGLHWGRIRLWGSAAFVLASSVGGLIVAAYSEGVVLWLILGGLVFMIVAASLAPKEKGAAAARSARYGPLDRFRVMFRDRRFVLLVAAAGAMQASHGVIYAFGTIYWRQIGMADTVIGGLWALGVLAEIILFAALGNISGRLDPARLLLLAGVAGVVRWTLMPLVDGIPSFALLQCLHAFTFGASHLAAIQFIARNVPVDLSATAQGLYSSLSMGLIVAGSMAMSGYLYEGYGAAAYWAMAGFCAIGCFIALALHRVSEKGSQTI